MQRLWLVYIYSDSDSQDSSARCAPLRGTARPCVWHVLWLCAALSRASRACWIVGRESSCGSQSCVGALLTQRDIVACCLSFGGWQFLSLGLVVGRMRSPGWGIDWFVRLAGIGLGRIFRSVLCPRGSHNGPTRLYFIIPRRYEQPLTRERPLTGTVTVTVTAVVDPRFCLPFRLEV